MTICLRTYLLEVAVGVLFLVAPGFSNVPPVVDLRTALNEGMPPRDEGMPPRAKPGVAPRPDLLEAVGVQLPSIRIKPYTALTRAPATETCRRANRRDRWRGCRETRRSG